MDKSGFNIIRELYFNKENRNIINELLKYINRSLRTKFMSAVFSVSDIRFFCTNCFKFCTPRYSYCDCVGLYLFCYYCDIDHFDKYSKLESIRASRDESDAEISFLHLCDIRGEPRPIIKYRNIKDLFFKFFYDIEDKIRSKPSRVMLN